MRVLILEDDEELAATLSDVLLLAGHEVSKVASVDEARAALSGSSAFDTAVFDLNLEQSNSIGLLREVKAQRPELRMVVMTGGGKVDAELGLTLATANGADEVLFKPFANDEFLAALAGTARAP